MDNALKYEIEITNLRNTVALMFTSFTMLVVSAVLVMITYIQIYSSIVSMQLNLLLLSKQEIGIPTTNILTHILNLSNSMWGMFLPLTILLITLILISIAATIKSYVEYRKVKGRLNAKNKN